jgi:hypothetical protein
MARKPQKSKPLNDPAEYRRFLDMAREVEADETPGALDRALGQVDLTRSPSPPSAAPHSPLRPSESLAQSSLCPKTRQPRSPTHHRAKRS